MFEVRGSIGLAALVALLSACEEGGAGSASTPPLQLGDADASTPPSECPTGTALLTPGCGTPEPTWKTGCYASCRAVGDDTGCAPGYTCQETWVNPCVPKPGENASCAACGQLTHLCMAALAAGLRGTGETTVGAWPACSQPSCETKSVEACKLDRRCAVSTGLKVDLELKCIGEAVEVGCEIAGTGLQACGEGITVASDASGQPFWFGDTCIPPSLNYLTPVDGSPQVAWAGYPRCAGL